VAAQAGGAFSPKGGDIKARLDIDLEEAIKGGKKRVAFSDGRTIDVTIPAGAQEGQTLRLKGQGSQGRGGIRRRPDRTVDQGRTRSTAARATQLVMDLPISIPDAVLGGKIEAPTPDGNVMLAVPKGSNSGQTLAPQGSRHARRQGQARRPAGPSDGDAAGDGRRGPREVRPGLARSETLHAEAEVGLLPPPKPHLRENP
jgi:DnaJ-class molecular chaperone